MVGLVSSYREKIQCQWSSKMVLYRLLLLLGDIKDARYRSLVLPEHKQSSKFMTFSTHVNAVECPKCLRSSMAVECREL